MSLNEKKEIFKLIYSTDYNPTDILYFQDIIRDTILGLLTNDVVEADRLADSKLNMLWKYLLDEIKSDINRNIVPVFDIVDNINKTVKWIGINTAKIDSKTKYRYIIRPELYRLIDSYDARAYEALACVLCKLLGANNIFLTPGGNEGGVDFFASIKFSAKAHFLFGNKGPLRIVGQCKKYATRDTIGHMKEFAQTLFNVYNQSYRVGEILPSWFKKESGPIMGWYISDNGFLSGALDYAKNFGILTSDTKEIIDLVCSSKIDVNICSKVEYVDKAVKLFLE